MDDEVLWETLAVHMPVLLEKLRRAAQVPETDPAWKF